MIQTDSFLPGGLPPGPFAAPQAFVRPPHYVPSLAGVRHLFTASRVDGNMSLRGLGGPIAESLRASTALGALLGRALDAGKPLGLTDARIVAPELPVGLLALAPLRPPGRSDTLLLVAADESARSDVDVVLEALQATAGLNSEAGAVPGLISHYFDLSQDLLLVTTRAGAIVRASASWKPVLGYDPEELVGKLASSLVYSDGQRNRLGPRRWLTGEQGHVSFENQVVASGGETRRFTWNAFIDGATGLVFASGRDMTAQYALVAESEAVRRRADELERVKDSLLANVSHEFRTPLTSILGFSDLLSLQLEGENAEFATLINLAGRRLLRMLDAMMDIAQMDAGAVVPEWNVVDVCALVERSVSAVLPEARDKGIGLDVDVTRCNGRVRTDAAMVGRLLDILLSNALKFTHSGSVRVVARTEVDGVVIEVMDTGIGIDADSLPRVFEPFRQGSEGLSRNYEGAGLGLCRARALADRLGGHISVSSIPGEGSRFTFRMPHRRSDQAP